MYAFDRTVKTSIKLYLKLVLGNRKNITIIRYTYIHFGHQLIKLLK